MLELKNICFSRDNKKILDNINLILENNKFISITGPNGSGKSTLAKIIIGIEKPDSGEIIFNGKDITNMSISERANLGLGYAFQTPVKFKGITVFDMIKLSAKKDMTKLEACDILSSVGLCAREYVDREVNDSLSGGELKRIEIASVVSKESEFTIFDEPEAGIDLWSFNSLINVFEKMREKLNGTILIISHQEKILNISDEIILLSSGTIKEHGRKEELFDKVTKHSSCYKLQGGKD
ncbi:MAG: ATP-binding cassette domain-containing protein [Clostridia bacterium]|nr:ATP-binding cassette domain-containing protein [Clostridia bacterium]